MAIQRLPSRDAAATPHHGTPSTRMRRSTCLRCTIVVGIVLVVTTMSAAQDFVSSRRTTLLPAVDSVPRELLRAAPPTAHAKDHVRGQHQPEEALQQTQKNSPNADDAPPAHFEVDHALTPPPKLTTVAPTPPPVTPAPPPPTTGTEVFAAQPMAGPLCVFIPANGHDEKHLKEVEAVLEAWGDASTLLFTENPLVMERTEEVATRKGIARALVEMEDWKTWQQELILAHASLRRRGATADSIRGRGQLSIPLFYWISQLVKRDDPLVQNCKWFMKCDTDTYLRRGLLEREVLTKLDHTKPYHVGVSLNFNTRPYHRTKRYINFQYNIGGPGYTFSRGLMEKVRIQECIESMTRDPVLLIHDDVATGYCASYHVDTMSHRIEVDGAVSSSSRFLVDAILNATLRRGAEGSVLAYYNLTAALRCARCVTAIHPADPVAMLRLTVLDRSLPAASTCEVDDRIPQPTSSLHRHQGPCKITLIFGAPSHVGIDWGPLPPPLEGLAEHWLPVSRRRRRGIHEDHGNPPFHWVEEDAEHRRQSRSIAALLVKLKNEEGL